MEPEIKYENSDSFFGPTETSFQNNCNISNFAAQMTTKGMHSETVGDYFSASNGHRLTDAQDGYRHLQALHRQQEPIGEQSSSKRSRRSENTILMSEPFFDIQEVYDATMDRGTLTARCLTCNVVLRGHKNVSSNFIKHLKRQHPELSKMYERLKACRLRKRTEKSPAAIGSNSTRTNDSIGEPSQGFDSVHSFLGQMRIIGVRGRADEEQNSEATCRSESAADSAECPESTGNATDCQYRLPTLRHKSNENLVNSSTSNDPSAMVVDISDRSVRIMGAMIDEKLKGLARTKERPEKFADEEKKQPIETPSLTTVQSQLDYLKQECKELRDAMQRSQQSKRQMQRELQIVDKMLRRRKFIVRNLQLDHNQDGTEAVENLLRDKLQLPHVAVKEVINISRHRPSSSSSEKQNFVVELRNEDDAKVVFKNCPKLKDSGVFIDPDLSYYARKRREKLLVLRKELLRRKADLKVMVRSSRLIVGGRRFYWDEIDGLSLDDDKDNDNHLIPTAVENLKTLTGLDMTEFLNVLKNYDVQMK